MQNKKLSEYKEAQQLTQLIHTMSYFTRKTMLLWMPEMLAKLGVTEERFRVLYELALQPRISLKDLAASMLVSKASMSVMVQSLVEQNLVIRESDPHDRRRVLLHLSSKGDSILATAETQLLQHYDSYLNCLTSQTKKDLLQTSERMLKVIEHVLTEKEG